MPPHVAALLGAAADTEHPPLLAAGLSLPDLLMDPTEHEVNLLVAYGDANPRVRPIAVKSLGSRGYADRIPPSWPELSTVQVHVDGRAWSLPDAQGRYLEPEDTCPPQPSATAVATGNEILSAAAGITGEAFWDIVAASRAQGRITREDRQAQRERVRAENAAYKRRRGIGTRKERGAGSQRTSQSHRPAAGCVLMKEPTQQQVWQLAGVPVPVDRIVSELRRTARGRRALERHRLTFGRNVLGENIPTKKLPDGKA